jgi:hypothetical protein
MFLQINDTIWIQAARIHSLRFTEDRVYLTFTDGTTDWFNLAFSNDPEVNAAAKTALLARMAALALDPADVLGG